MEEVLIHIGFHKTGTSWLQQELFVRGNEVFEPLSRRDSGPSSLAAKFIYDHEFYLLSSYDLNESIIRDELKSIQESHPIKGKKIGVISHERLSGNPNSGGFDASIIAGRIKNIFPKAKILIVIREQKLFLLSSYFQHLQMGGTFGIHKYLNTKYDGQRPGFSPHHIDYYKTVTHYYSLFGRESVLVLPFELFKNDKISFLNHLGRFVGKKIQAQGLPLDIEKNKRTHHLFVSYFFRRFNFFIKSSSMNHHSFLANKYTRFVAKAILKVIKTLTPDSFNTLTQKSVQKRIDRFVGDRYQLSNLKLSELIDLDLSEYGYHPQSDGLIHEGSIDP